MVAYEAAPRVLIVGLGTSGLAAARLAADDGSEVWVTDLRLEQEMADPIRDLPGGARTFFGGHPETCLEGVKLVVVSPGVSPQAPVLAAARERGLEIRAEVEFAWLHQSSAPLAAVTGSNGKSTVTELVARMLANTGLEVGAGGNLGPAASQLVLDGGWQSWVLEVSSFQAEILTEMRPGAAVFLNLSQDHLERHPDLEAYLEAKRRLFAFQGHDDIAVLNADDPAVAGTVTAARRRTFSVTGKADAFLDGDHLLLDEALLIEASGVKLCGRHNLANTLAAALAAQALGATTDAMVSAIENFEGLAHRHRTVHVANGVRWVDDSKATNVGATVAALGGYPEGSVHLIMGGQAKGQDFAPLLPEMRRAVVRLYLIGEDGPLIGEFFRRTMPLESCGDLAEAVRRARSRATAGQWILLAPACASFDQFSSYSERGDHFADLASHEVVPCP
jgi:UDP-N-acetylmuramoylalanine--D-glutamate ligase